MKIVFMGTPSAAVPSLERLVRDGHEVVAVYTQPDKPSGRGNKVAPSPVKQFAIDHGLPVFQPKKIRTPEAYEELRSQAANVAVVVAYGRILPETFLSAFPMGAINVHFSLLPRYRGAAPVNWAIVHEEKKTGVTTMQMDAGLDTGPILLQRETDIDENETAIELMQRLAQLGADLLSETLSRYSELKPFVQNESEASFAPVMKKEDGLISWMLSARQISARVRGFQPFPTAFTYFHDRKLTVWKARPVESDHQLSTPGEILQASGDALRVFCGGDSILQIDEVQLEGKRRLTARDFINGVRPRVGEILGS
ncbi:MAG TPA: methionyl-tRNA formyltransferase [Pyrinomonadaceae bacterium]